MGNGTEASGPGPWIRGAVWALGLGLGVVVALGSALYSDLRADSMERYGRCSERITDVSRRKQALSDNFRQLALEVATLAEHANNNDYASKGLAQKLEKADARLQKLATNANARPDPFTGTEGRALERRIDRLELTGEKVTMFMTQVAQLQKDFSEVQGFYRRQVLPLIEQSNALQQQRIQQNMQ
jgi:hypothetical protein